MPAIRPAREKALNDNRRMLSRLSAFVIWALIAATAVFWLLRLGVSLLSLLPLEELL